MTTHLKWALHVNWQLYVHICFSPTLTVDYFILEIANYLFPHPPFLVDDLVRPPQLYILLRKYRQPKELLQTPPTSADLPASVPVHSAFSPGTLDALSMLLANANVSHCALGANSSSLLKDIAIIPSFS